jgi:hypothetical protein
LIALDIIMTNTVRTFSAQLAPRIRTAFALGAVIASLTVAGCASGDFTANGGNHGFSIDPCRNGDLKACGEP